MAAIRMLFSWLTEKGVLAMNPAREVKTERFSRTEGKTPAFVEGEVQKLLGLVETSTHTGLRDRALLGVLAYTFARIGKDEDKGDWLHHPMWPSGRISQTIPAVAPWCRSARTRTRCESVGFLPDLLTDIKREAAP